MGLDMYLRGSLYVSGWDKNTSAIAEFIEDAMELEPVHLEFEIMTWRKSNNIHRWFVENVQDGKDDCGRYYVSEGQLKELYETIQKVLKKEAEPDECLPTQEGFFFGNTDYDEYYFKDLERTREMLEKIFKEEKYKNLEFYYSSSW